MVGFFMFWILSLTWASASGDVSQYQKQEGQYGDTFPNAAYALDAFNNLDYPSCIKIGQASVKLEPKNPDPHFVMGRCYERMLDFEKSWREYNSVIKLNPKYKDAQSNRVLLSLKLFNLVRAKRELAAWKKREPKDKRISEYEGYLSQAIKQTKEGEYTAAYAKENIKEGYRNSLKYKKNTYRP